MKAWIIYNESDAINNKRYIEFYIEEGKSRNIDVRLVIIENISFGVEHNMWYIKEKGEKLDAPDFVICRTIYPLLSKQLEYMGLKVFNNSFVSEICNDKAKTYQYVASIGIDMVDTEFCKNERINKKLINMTRSAVIKTVNGHGGKQVFLINEPSNQADKLIENVHSRTKDMERQIHNDMMQSIEKADVVIQPLVGHRNQDLRVYVIGKTIVAAVLRTAKDGFKSNFSLGGEVRLYQLKEEETSIVNKIIDLFDFGLVGIDFIIDDEGKLIFNEIEDVVGARMLYQCSDINIVKLYLEYIADNI